MYHNRLFKFLIIVVLFSMATLTVRQAWAISQVITAADGQSLAVSTQQDDLPVRQCPFSPAERRSLRAVYVKEMGLWLTRTDSGFTGVEGGGLALLEC